MDKRLSDISMQNNQHLVAPSSFRPKERLNLTRNERTKCVVRKANTTSLHFGWIHGFYSINSGILFDPFT